MHSRRCAASQRRNNNTNRAGWPAPAGAKPTLKMRLRILEPLERNARAAIKSRPEFRRLERERSSIIKMLTAGKYTPPQARGLLQLLRLRRKILMLREVYLMMRAA
jgi:hypothetical protein